LLGAAGDGSKGPSRALPLCLTRLNNASTSRWPLEGSWTIIPLSHISTKQQNTMLQICMLRSNRMAGSVHNFPIRCPSTTPMFQTLGFPTSRNDHGLQTETQDCCVSIAYFNQQKRRCFRCAYWDATECPISFTTSQSETLQPHPCFKP
jgi:hypothetical protein